MPARRPRPKRQAKRASAPRGKRQAKRARAPRAKRPSRTRATSVGAGRSAASARDAIGFVSQHMDYTSHDIEAIRRFYTRLLGFGDFQYLPANQYLAVRTGPTSSLGFMPPMPGPPEDWRPPREPTLYLFVEDVDRACRDLTERGVTIDRPPADMPWGHRVAQLRDPEGRSITLAQNKRR
jgi:predicted enzyme related to lactoylglutathione lyase